MNSKTRKRGFGFKNPIDDATIIEKKDDATVKGQFYFMRPRKDAFLVDLLFLLLPSLAIDVKLDPCVDDCFLNHFSKISFIA